METFFQESFTVDEIETEELLLRRYSNIEYVLNKAFDEGYKLIRKAHEKDIEDKLWEQWLVDYRFMDSETFISFEEYKGKIINPQNKIDKMLSKQQIEEKVKGIIELTL